MEIHPGSDDHLDKPDPANRILLLGAGLGILADQLIGTTGPVGAGFLVWTVLFALSLGWLGSISRGGISASTTAWSAIAVIAATLMLFRNVPIILLSLLLVMTTCMAMILLHMGSRSLLETELAEHIKALVMVPLQGWFGAWPLLATIDVGAGLRKPGLWSGLRGALLALPLLLIFVGLFSSADASFDRLVGGLFNLFAAETFRHLTLSLILAWLSIGLLASVRGNHYFVATRRLVPLKLETVDTAVLMGSLVALFLVFVYLQLGYLFGGRETIESTSGLTLALYARRGFFELLAVAGLTLLVLIVLAGSGCNKRVFRPLAAVLAGCVLIIQASAVQRLMLYIEEFGLTIDRLTALAVLVWIASGILLFTGTLLRGRIKAFAAGMTCSGIAAAFVLALINPGALVTRVNITRTAENQQALDIQHLLDLGSDAVPALIENLEKLTVPQRCEPVAYLYANWYEAFSAPGGGKIDWRGWTYSRYLAEGLIVDFENELKELAGPCLVGGLVIDHLGRPQPEVFVNHGKISARSLYRWINDT